MESIIDKTGIKVRILDTQAFGGHTFGYDLLAIHTIRGILRDFRNGKVVRFIKAGSHVTDLRIEWRLGCVG